MMARPERTRAAHRRMPEIPDKVLRRGAPQRPGSRPRRREQEGVLGPAWGPILGHAQHGVRLARTLLFPKPLEPICQFGTPFSLVRDLAVTTTLPDRSPA